MRLTAVDRPGAQTTYNSHSEREYNPMDTEVQNEVAIDLETPYRWGKEDALEGVDRANGLPTARSRRV